MFAASPTTPKSLFRNGTANIKRSRGHQSLGSRTAYDPVSNILKPSSTVSGKVQSKDGTMEQAEVVSSVVLDRRFLLANAVLVSLLGVAYPYPANAVGLGKNTKELAKAYVECYDVKGRI
jgi:hypothetical protein